VDFMEHGDPIVKPGITGTIVINKIYLLNRCMDSVK